MARTSVRGNPAWRANHITEVLQPDEDGAMSRPSSTAPSPRHGPAQRPGSRSTEPRTSRGLGPSVLALLVDSDEERRARVGAAIREISRRIDEVDDEEQAIHLIGRSRYDLIVVAADLFSASGLLVVQRLRPKVSAGILVTAAAHSSLAVVTALEVGADDCCTGPTSTRELLLRAEMAVDRRRSLIAAAATHQVMATDARYRIDPATRQVTIEGVDIPLTAKQFDLLHVLAGAPGTVFTRAELLDLVWNSRPEWQSLDTVTEHVYRIRQRLKHGSVRAEWIQTVHGAGYRFVLPSTTDTQSEAALTPRNSSRS